MRAGGLQDVTTFYRNDRTPTRGTNPHGFLLDPTLTGRNLGQAQVLDFLASGGATISDPDGPAPVFEVPIADPASLETLNFAQDPATGEPPPEAAAAATGSCTGAVTGSAATLRGARRLQEREGAPARAPGPLRLLAPRAGRARRSRSSRRRSAGASSATGGSRASRAAGGRSPGAGAAPATACCSPASACAWPGRAATCGASRCAAVTAASGSAASFYRRRSCDLLTQYKLGSPAFGGRSRKPLRIAFRLSRTANVSVRVQPRRPRGQALRDRASAGAHDVPAAAASGAGSPAARTACRITVRGGPGTVRSTLVRPPPLNAATNLDTTVSGFATLRRGWMR